MANVVNTTCLKVGELSVPKVHIHTKCPYSVPVKQIIFKEHIYS